MAAHRPTPSEALRDAPAARRPAADVRRRDDFERVVVETMPRLLGTARRLLRGGWAAEEVVAEALFRAWRHRGSFRGDAAPSSWLHRIVCRAAADRVRGRARERDRRAALAARPPRAARAPSARERASARELHAHLRAAVDALPDRQRLVLVLHAWEGLSLTEIAEVLRVRYATAKSNLCHARRALRARLDAEARP
jgi:RNA polymerase sigma-70 factor (ECF subfamily)